MIQLTKITSHASQLMLTNDLIDELKVLGRR
ncbi:hypothetical protein J2T16_002753 [Paenibacillus intestini]|nr:hypothetical protein [Paenibacillus intestini]